MNMRRILFSAGTIVLLIAIAACMMVVGRGHTVYFDNKKLEYEGETYDTPRRINVFVGGEQVAKLSAKERGMATCMGQSIAFDLEVTWNKGDDPETYSYTLKLPYGTDGIVVNLPGLIKDLPKDAWQSEFVPLVTETEEDDVDLEGIDEFGLDAMESEDEEG